MLGVRARVEVGVILSAVYLHVVLQLSVERVRSANLSYILLLPVLNHLLVILVIGLVRGTASTSAALEAL